MGSQTGQKYAAAVSLATYANCSGLDNNLRMQFVLRSCLFHVAFPALNLYAANPGNVAYANYSARSAVGPHAASAPFAFVARYVACAALAAYAFFATFAYAWNLVRR